MCMTVRVHVCGWVAFSILERGIPSVDKKRGMLERSDKPWGANGGCEYLCACMYVFARALILQCGCTLPTSSGMRWGGRGAQRQESRIRTALEIILITPSHTPGIFISASVSLLNLSISSLYPLFYRARLYHQDLRPLPTTTPTLLAIFGRSHSRLHRCFRPSRSYAAHRGPRSSSGGGSG